MKEKKPDVTLEVYLKNCYGIGEFKQDFVFTEKNKSYLIYASNGVMKTSFAKTFEDYAKQKETFDLLKGGEETVREIDFKKDGKKTSSFKIHCVKADFYEKEDSEEALSTLLVNEKLREKYIKISKKIESLKKEIKKKIMEGAKFRKESFFLKEYWKEKLIPKIEDLRKKEWIFCDDEFKTEAEGVSLELIEKNKAKLEKLKIENKENLEKYFVCYQKLLKESKFFREGFSQLRSIELEKTLKLSKFFEAGHLIELYDGKKHRKISSSEELKKAFEEERSKFLKNVELKKMHQKIFPTTQKDEKILNLISEKRTFFLALEKGVNYLIEKILCYFLEKERELCNSLLNEYNSKKTEIEKILEEAKKEETTWREVIEIFNHTFNVPYTLKAENKEDVVLGKGRLHIKYIFKKEEKKSIPKDIFREILSSGEKRAFCFLDILFKIKIAKKEQENILIIFDDVANCFDQKNKYAILEYLKRISKEEEHTSKESKIYMLIFTHNFYFYLMLIKKGIISNKDEIQNDYVLYASKKEDKKVSKISLKKINLQKGANPFFKIKEELSNEKLSNEEKLVSFVAFIPFARNIIEYTKGTKCECLGKEKSCFDLLSWVLHIKEKSLNFTLKNIKQIFKKHSLLDEEHLDFLKKSENKKKDESTIRELIFKAAEICSENTEEKEVKLKIRIVLAIAIRLKAELLKKKKKKTKEEDQLCKRAFFITSDLIHISAFVFEAIIDFDFVVLKEIYKDICNSLKVDNNF